MFELKEEMNVNEFGLSGGEEEEAWNVFRVWIIFERVCFEDSFKDDNDAVICSVDGKEVGFRCVICKGRLVVGSDSFSSMLFGFVVLLMLML